MAVSSSSTSWVKKSPSYYSHRPGSGSWKVDGGGVLINQAIHQLDALISFLGEPREVSASMDTCWRSQFSENFIACP